MMKFFGAAGVKSLFYLLIFCLQGVAFLNAQNMDSLHKVYTGYFNAGTSNAEQGKYPEALKNYLAALRISESLGKKPMISQNYMNIGNLYFAMGNLDEALKNFEASLEIEKGIGDKNGIATAYGNMGNVYGAKGDMPGALKNIEAALAVFREMGNKRGIGLCQGNLGNVYAELGKPEEALKSYLEALRIQEEEGVPHPIASSCNNIGILYNEMHQPAKAKEWLVKGLKVASGANIREDIKEAYSALATADSATGNYKDAFLHYKLYVVYRDSLVNEENTRRTVQLQMQYEFDKKEEATRIEQEKKDAVVAADNRRHFITLVAVSGVGVLLLLLAIVIFRSLRMNQKKNEIITRQKEIVEEKQKEILDSIHYAKRIQTALLPSERYLERNLNKINDNRK